MRAACRCCAPPAPRPSSRRSRTDCGSAAAAARRSARSARRSWLESLQPRDVVARDATAHLERHAGEDAIEQLLRLGKRALGVRIIRAPHHEIDADQLPIAHAERVILKAQEEVAAEAVAGTTFIE